MTNFDKLKNMNIDELAKFIDDHGMYDNTPWMNWWSETYCENCKSVELNCAESIKYLGLTPFFEDDVTLCAYCEVYNKCRFFEAMDHVPETQEIIKLWLEEETDED